MIYIERTSNSGARKRQRQFNECPYLRRKQELDYSISKRSGIEKEWNTNLIRRLGPIASLCLRWHSPLERLTCGDRKLVAGVGRTASLLQ